MILIESVAPDSLGEELGLTEGTALLAINGRELHDFLDWEFLAADHRFVLTARMPDGQLVEYDVERPEALPMGVEVEPPRIRRCGNRCDFCFVDGLPGGLRENLYIRDDDYRLSFRHGNFATLTNLKPGDVERIIEYRLSPLYVSVHATDPVVRRRLLRNPRAPDILRQLSTFAEAGIQFHTQIVLQPGVNDGAELARSLHDLFALGPAVLSVSVVPVGLTEFSRHARCREPTRDECRATVTMIHEFADRAMADRGERWVHGSDELYLVADLPLPPATWYGGFEQVENGVGSVRYLQSRIADAVSLPSFAGRQIGVVTGSAMGRLMDQVIGPLCARTGGEWSTFPLENDLFGPRVTTAGLLPGRAVASLIDAHPAIDLFLIPAESLNDHGVFIDDLSFASMRADRPHRDIRASYDFVDVLVPA